ncbi:MAG: hypothetical protein F2667_10280 [Actinobacteria bacterium]|uniref:Unannotated protein n=1 Tax=freshwater metagenome TaxID=449393 RepID=A0A6J6RIJ1_9ZZZZ|nr:hypothetical protein [Actinomycetota bacterium]
MWLVRGRARERDERGAVAAFVAVLLSVLLVSAAFAVDLGRQRVVRSDMQSLADVVALDMVRQLRGRYAMDIEGDSTWQQALAKSVARNGSTLGSTPNVQVELGVVDATGAFTPVGGEAKPDAVRVSASSTINFAFVPGQGGATRTAVAATEPVACFKMGSYALDLNSGNSAILNSLINDALNLSAISYDGLSNASVSLLGLATELNAGSVDGLLALPSLSLGTYYAAAATVLQREGGETADVQLLQALSLQVASLPNVAVSQILSLSPGADSALATSVNLLDLVATSALVSNGSSALALPNLSVGLGLTSLSSSLSVIEKAREGCGPVNKATASTSQVSLSLGGTLVGLPAILGTTATASMTLSVQAASANGTLIDVSCGTFAAGSPDTETVAVGDGLVTLNLQVPIVLKVLGVTVLSGTVKVQTTPPLAPSNAWMNFPSLASYSTKYPTGSGNVGLTGVTVDTSDLRLIGLPIGLTLNGLTSGILSGIVNPLIGRLDSVLLSPLLGVLGVQVSGAEVYGVPRPNCDHGALRQ